MRVAFFGGSFDPPHLGHLAIARAAQQALALDTVLFAPVGHQPLKAAHPDSHTSYAHRLAMTQLAIEHQPHFQISLADAPKAHPENSPNYTIDTLLQLRPTLPLNTHLYLLIGADSLHTFARWHRAAEIPFAADLIVASRPGEPLTHLDTLLPPPLTLTPTPNPDHFQIENPTSRQTAQLHLLPNLHYEISATQLRHQIQNTTTTPGIPQPVLNYIHQNHLYPPS